MKKLNVIIDTDPGADDSVANLIAMHSDRLNILLFTCMAGNVETETTTRNLLATVEISGKDIPVAVGAVKPLKLDHKDARYIHMKEGMGGYEPTLPKIKPIKKHAVQAMYEEICKHKNDITIIELGPQTNLAMLIKKHPDVVDMISQIIYMGASSWGEFEDFNHVSFNIRTDPHAFKIVYDSPIPLTMIPSEIGRASYLNLEQVKSLKKSKKYGKFLYKLMIGYKEPGYKEHRSAMNDSCAILYATSPSIFKTKNCDIEIDLKETPGKTFFTYKKNGRVKCITDINIKKFHKTFFTLLNQIDIDSGLRDQ